MRMQVRPSITQLHSASHTKPQLDIKLTVVAATELRDQVDIWCSGAHYPVFLQKFVPVLLKLLDGPPVFISTSPEQVVLSLSIV
jgi:transformation/transcription domain-associated protein